MLITEIIRHKRDQQELSSEEIDFLMDGVCDWSVTEGQIAALTMAIYLRGLNSRETADLTRAIVRSGKKMDWSTQNLNGPIIDIHSTGSIGDKTGLIFAPLLAACGAYIPMVSERGSSYYTSTADKIDSIFGYNISPSLDMFYKTTKEAGCAIVGQVDDLTMADKRLYTVRKEVGTLEAFPLTISSILAKKIAAGVQGVLVDIRCPINEKDFLHKAEQIALFAREVASYHQVKSTAILSTLDQVIGDTVGNSVELIEAVNFLKGKHCSARLYQHIITLASQALLSNDLAHTEEEAKLKVTTALEKGTALEHFAKMITLLGGAPDFVDCPEKHIPQMPVIRPVYTLKPGYLFAVNTREIGSALVELGGVRRKIGEEIDYDVGLTEFKHIGDYVDSDTPICIIHARNEDSFAKAQKIVQNAIQTSEERPVLSPVIIETINMR
ncbi:MAG: thymidine phosphorylase [Alphaproteobacteria bacterium]|nr:thymidine phosphorylase [Alphaproteobacteria bacterium]